MKSISKEFNFIKLNLVLQCLPNYLAIPIRTHAHLIPTNKILYTKNMGSFTQPIKHNHI